jgi:cytochrome P450
VVLNAEFKARAHEEYTRLRSIGPIHQVRLASGIDGWLVVGYDLAREALTHPSLLKDWEPAADKLAAAGYILNKPGVGLGGHMLESDPPAHSRLRRLVSGAFTPRRSAELAPRIEQIAEFLLDSLLPAGEIDLVTAFTAPLPVTVIAELLGIPEEDRDDFRTWAATALEVGAPGHADAVVGLHRLLGKLIPEKRRQPTDDLLSALVAARDEDNGRLSEEELVGTALLLVIAGHDTTVNLLGNAVLALLDHPEQLHTLRERPELIENAVEEFLRYDTSVENSTPRYAADDLTLGEVRVSRGDVVVVALASASRDAPLPPGRDASVLDVTAPAPRHMSFGHGIHHCLGAPLARLEATIALRTLLRRTRCLELALDRRELSWIGSGMMRGVLSLPVRYELED